jgi:hypothetical protein
MNVKKIICFLIFLFLATTLQAEQDFKIYKNNLKTTFLSFITGSAKLTYERAVFENQSFEITAGIIGIGSFDKIGNRNHKGGLLRIAYKFIPFRSQDNPLNGFYHKPEYAFSTFDYNWNSNDDPPFRTFRSRSSMHTIMYDAGYQRVVNRLVFDGFVGAGLGWGKVDSKGDIGPFDYRHGFISINNRWDNPRPTLTFGMRVGFAF